MDNMDLPTRVVTVTGIGIIAAALGFVLFWIVTRSLETYVTLAAAIVISLLAGGIILLAQRGYTPLAAWLLAGFVFLLNAANVYQYGISSTSSAAFLISIIIVALAIGPVQGYILTGLSLACIWGVGYAASSGALKTEIPYQVSHLTFDAPFLTIFFILIAVMVGQVKR